MGPKKAEQADAPLPFPRLNSGRASEERQPRGVTVRAVQPGDRVLDGESHRAARSASFSCAKGYPNSAISPSPSFLETVPRIAVTAADATSK